jgi:AcrR family transcriptional regulator
MGWRPGKRSSGPMAGQQKQRNAAAKAPAAKPKRRVRANPDDRYREFVQKAVKLFAEVGFDGGTRELAKRLNVTQPLLYRYFPSKGDLIAAVYQEIYLARWKPEWRSLLMDDSLPIRERLVRFYEDYTATIFAPDWIRIYLFAGLRGVDINKRYIANIERDIVTPVVHAMRRSLGLPGRAAPRPDEVELFWTLHGGIFYHGVREVVYGLPMTVSRSTMIANAVDLFVTGAGAVFGRKRGNG